MFETRGLQLEVVRKPDATEEPRVVAHIYADDDCSPVVQAFAIPLSRVRIVLKSEFGSLYCIDSWSLQDLIKVNI